MALETCRHGCVVEGGCSACAIEAPLLEALQRIVVCCDNGSLPENKLTFIRRVACDALNEEVST